MKRRRDFRRLLAGRSIIFAYALTITLVGQCHCTVTEQSFVPSSNPGLTTLTLNPYPWIAGAGDRQTVRNEPSAAVVPTTVIPPDEVKIPAPASTLTFAEDTGVFCDDVAWMRSSVAPPGDITIGFNTQRTSIAPPISTTGGGSSLSGVDAGLTGLDEGATGVDGVTTGVVGTFLSRCSSFHHQGEVPPTASAITTATMICGRTDDRGVSLAILAPCCSQ